MASTVYDPMDRAGLEFWLHTQAGDNSERRRRLLRNLPKAVAAELTPRQREMLELYIYHNMSVTDIADALGVKPEEVLEMETRMTGQDVALIADDGDEDGYAPIDWLADHDNEPVRTLERRAHDRLQSEGLREALDGLDARSRRIVETRWLADEGDRKSVV